MSTPVMRRSPSRDAVPRPRAQRRRQPEIDWLRTIVVLAIIPYHTFLMFAPSTNSVIKHTINVPMAALVGSALQTWGIALIFMLSGAASKFALEVRSSRAYLRERVLRLLPPLVLTALVFTPLHVYFLLKANPGLVAGSSDVERLRHIGTFFLQYWTILFTTGNPIALGNMFLYLWFVPRMLVVSILSVPLFIYLRATLPHWITRLARSRRALDLVLVVGGGLTVAVVVTVLEPTLVNWPLYFSPLVGGRLQFPLDLVAFICGYLLYSSGQLVAAVQRLAYLTLGLAVPLWVLVFAMGLWGFAVPVSYSPAYILFSVTQTLAVWVLLLAAFGLALRYLTMTPAWLSYLTTASFPVFVLHTPLLIMAAYYLQAVPAPWYVLLPLIAIVTLAAAFAMYEGIVRRFALTRFIFGLEAPRSPGDIRKEPPTPTPNPPAPVQREQLVLHQPASPNRVHHANSSD